MLYTHLAIWLTVASQFAFLPYGDNRWSFIKLTVMCVGIVFAALAPATGRLADSASILIALGLGMMLISTALQGVPVQLLGRSPRYEGLVAISVYIGSIWAGARLLGPGATRNRTSFWLALAVAAIATGIVTVSQRTDHPLITTSSDRPGSLLGNATDMGVTGSMLAILLVPPIARLLRDRRHLRRPARLTRLTLLALGLLSSLLVAVLSASRAAYLTLVVAAIVVLVFALASRRRLGIRLGRRVLVPTGLALIGILAISMVVPSTRARLLGTSDFAVRTIVDRFEIYRSTLDLAADHLWLGLGLNGFVENAPNSFAPGWFTDITLNSPHNWVLQVLVIGGVPLLLWSAATVLWCAWMLWRAVDATLPRRRARHGDAVMTPPLIVAPDTPEDRRGWLISIGAALAGYIAAMTTAFTSPDNTLLASLIAGAALSVQPTTRPAWAFTSTWPKHVQIALKTVGMVLLVTWTGWMACNTAAEVPMRTAQLALARSNYAYAEQHFAQAVALRPWDADIPRSAAQQYAALAGTGDATAGALAVQWAQRALDEVPGMIRARHALATGLEATGDISSAQQVWQQLAIDVPGNPLYAQQAERLRTALTR